MIPYCILAIEDESDREYMTALFVQYEKLMYSTIGKITTNYSDTEDVLQSTLEKLIDKISLLKTLDRNHLVNYIISACKNTAYNELRYQSRHGALSFDDCLDSADVENDGHIMEARLVREDELGCLARIWPELDERSQYVLEAYYILEKKAEKIAQDLDIKPESVRMALTRARKSAYKLMEKELNIKI